MKKLLLKSLVLTAAVAFSLLTVQCNKAEDVQSAADNSTYNYVSPVEKAMLPEESTDGVDDIIACIYECLSTLPAEDLSESEIATLNYVREEEYLAHDVYVAMYDLYHIPVFNNISNSEYIHSAAIKALMEKYELPDPAANHVLGVFEDESIQALYDALVAQGSVSLQDAMIVGATIEDFDIRDLTEHLMNDVDNADITYILEQLCRGSRNHMRAFNAHITFQGLTYTPQYITQEMFDEIINSAWETGNGFCMCNVSCADAVNDGRVE